MWKLNDTLSINKWIIEKQTCGNFFKYLFKINLFILIGG